MKSIRTMKTKFCAIFLALCLALPQASALAEEKDALVDIGNMAIPESLGKIEERFQGTSKHWVIDIQDVHAHFGAQENIAAIIDHLNEVYGLRLVAYEGGWNVTSFPKTWEIQSSRQKQLVLRTLMEEDLITGPAFAAMNSKTPITLHGVEDAEIYKQNLRVYLKFIEHKDSVEKDILNFQETLSHKKTALYNPALLDFDHSLLQFREDSKAAEKFLPRLLTLSKTLALDLNGLPQMQLFIQVSDIEKSIDKTKLKSEIDRIMQEHKNSRLSFEEMLRHGTLTDEKLSFYPNAQKQHDLLKLTDQIAHDQLFAEIDKTVLRVKEKLFKNSAEKELNQEFDRFLTAKKVMIFKATPADMKLYRASKTLTLKEMRAAHLDKHLKLGSAFYSLAEKRNQIFFKNIITAPELSSEDIALVAGGFHTEGVRELLRGAGVSYIVVTPQLGQESTNETLYLRGLQELKVLAQTLSKFYSYSDLLDQELAALIRQFSSNNGLLNNNLQGAVAAFRTFALPATKTPTRSFLSLSDKAQRDATAHLVENYIATAGNRQTVVVLKAETLTALLTGDHAELAQVALDAFTHNPRNLLVVTYGNSILEIPDAVDTLLHNVKTLRSAGFESALSMSILQKALQDHRVAVISNDFKKDGVLILPEELSYFLASPALLEGWWNFTMDTPEAVTAFVKFVEEALAAKGFSASA